MLLEFGAKNFCSFKEGFEVSLRLGSSCPDSISKKKSYTNILAIKGANASGKTNVLKLLSFIRYFSLDSFNLKPDEDIDMISYFNNDEVIVIYIIFLDKNIEYTYEVELTQHEILAETVYKKDKRTIPIIQRKKDKFVYVKNEYKSLKSMKLRKNVSFISLAIQYEFNEIDFLHTFFNKIMTNVHSLGRNDEFLNEHEFVTEFYHNNNQIFKFVKDILKQSDTGIHDIKIRKRFDEETKETVYYPIFEYSVNEEDNFLTFYEQSSGVKALYQQLFVYALALQEGGILVLDEFDINLHPDLLPMLVNFFEDKSKNKKDAQFIFSTHNSDIMDKLGKYRIVLVNKIDNESFLYRLDEISGDIIRNDRPLTPIYKSGKIGGKPRLQYEEAV